MITNVQIVIFHVLLIRFARYVIILSILPLFTGCNGESDNSELLTYNDDRGKNKPVKTLEDWDIKRGQMLDDLQSVMGKLPDLSALPPLNVKINDSLVGEGYVRYTVVFTAVENEDVPAFLYLPFPRKAHQKYPAMLALHPTGAGGKGIVDGQSPLHGRAYAKELAQRGYVVIAPDYPSFGELGDYDFKNDRYESGTMKGIFDHIRCIDLLCERSDIDPQRIGVIGHSLGGHNAMFVAAFDTRLKAVVSSCGWTELAYYDIGPTAEEKYGGRLGPFAQERYMPLFRDKYQLDGNKVPFDFHEIIALIAPRAFFSNSPVNDENFAVKGVEDGIGKAAEAYRFLNAENNLQVRYPDAGHDFPNEIRSEVYQFIDEIFGHDPKVH